MNGQTVHAPRRGAFEGVAKILRYNWPQYVVGTIVVITASGVALFFPSLGWARWILLAGASLAAWWLCASLVASHWVYDRSRLYRWDWARSFGPNPPLRWVNVHAGLDESTQGLAVELRQPPLAVLDIFDPTEMTEASIARARREAEIGWPSIHCAGTIPAEIERVDVVFAIFCLHEVRRESRRIELMTDLASRLSGGGRVIVVEHLRDAANFAVFGAGFAHFLSRRAWMTTFSRAALRVVNEQRVTPFVRVFELQRST